MSVKTVCTLTFFSRRKKDDECNNEQTHFAVHCLIYTQQSTEQIVVISMVMENICRKANLNNINKQAAEQLLQQLLLKI